MLEFNCDKFQLLSIRQVSSAKSLGLQVVQLEISFMYKVKRRGPRTDPSGTPQVMGIKLDLTLPIDTN